MKSFEAEVPQPPDKTALRIPALVAGEIVSGEVPIRVLARRFEHGGVYPAELTVINRIAACYSPESIFEFGTFNGRTTLNMAANTGKACVIYTLDLPEGGASGRSLRPHPADEKYIALRTVGRHFLKTPYRKKIRQLFGDSASFDFGPLRGTVDLVFIDGSHSYDYVMSDSKKALLLLKEGRGLMLWHDYGTIWDEVTRALNDLSEKEPVFAGMRHIEGTSLVVLRRS